MNKALGAQFFGPQPQHHIISLVSFKIDNSLATYRLVLLSSGVGG